MRKMLFVGPTGRRSVLYVLGVCLMLAFLLSADNMCDERTVKRSASRRPAISIQQRREIAALSKQLNIVGRFEPGCRNATYLQIVAHQDDDLLFMNPDIQHHIQGNDCVVTVFMTAGDIGRDEAYVLGREHGAKAAYAHMASMPEAVWTDSVISVGSHRVRVSQMQNNRNATLMFLRLQDGNVGGHGFEGRTASLKRIFNKGESAATIAGDSYTLDQLTNFLTALLVSVEPQIVRSHSPHHENDGDHSDHISVGHLVVRATKKYIDYSEHRKKVRLKQYIGYPVRGRAINVPAHDQEAKRTAFFTYAPYDDAMCPGGVCAGGTDSYEDYHSRQYSREFIIR